MMGLQPPEETALTRSYMWVSDSLVVSASNVGY
jgi:hypothetical protein